MANIPNFATELLSIESQLRIQADLTARDWQDCVKDSFYRKYIDDFCHNIEKVVNGDHNGDCSMHGQGMNKMLEEISDCFDQMANISGTSASNLFEMAMGDMYDGSVDDSYGHKINVENHYDVQIHGGQIYDKKLNRTYWDPKYNGPDIGKMTPEEIAEIMKRRNRVW